MRRHAAGGSDDILKKYNVDVSALGLAAQPGGDPPGAAAGRQPKPTRQGLTGSRKGLGHGVFLLLLLNFGVYAATRLLQGQPALAALPLYHLAPRWWQFVTAAFCHANWEHLSSNAFSLLIFGRIVEEEEGAFGVWATYLLCGVGGCVASYLSAPRSPAVTLGASAAVFGLFAVAALTRLRPTPRHAMEALVLGSFVGKQLMQEVHMVAAGQRAAALGGMQVGHVAHLAGAVVGLAIVLLLARLPPGER